MKKKQYIALYDRGNKGKEQGYLYGPINGDELLCRISDLVDSGRYNLDWIMIYEVVPSKVTKNVSWSLKGFKEIIKSDYNSRA